MENGVDGVSDAFSREAAKAKHRLHDYCQAVSRLEGRITNLPGDLMGEEFARWMEDESRRLDGAEAALTATLNEMRNHLKLVTRYYQKYSYWEDIEILERERIHTRKRRDVVETHYRSLCEGKAQHDRSGVSEDPPLQSRFR